ncbi:putative PSP, proline-rich [Rosa chinensis]|uniref:Putative PSP, proline-rich n=1 Tax=Rosa chinensis TaxID=74649 RepID=A0A2P6QR03_ROSCH|nr:putative PSP, proline-rich [Rosa chinensis]
MLFRRLCFRFCFHFCCGNVEPGRTSIEKEDSKKLKQKQQECMQPKMGKMDIDYQVKLREKKPGMLSHELKEGLGVPDGAPPPWLINIQYGQPLYGNMFGVQQQDQPNYENEKNFLCKMQEMGGKSNKRTSSFRV